MNSKETEETNQRQKEFYNTKKKNLPTKFWFYLRNGLLNKTKKNIGMEKQILNLHTSWMGELADKKVLDLGCYAGNSLSFYLAQNSRDYTGIDLSEKGIESLSNRLKDIPTARAIAIDFLSSNFTEKNFDIIYAYGVLHHFKDIDILIARLNEKLGPNGKIISYDPLKTSLPIKFIRTVYRPFQSDKDWEWPFSKKIYYQFQKSFEIKERRAVLGNTKWFFLLELLPFSKNKKAEIAQKWHQEDWEKSNRLDSHMFSCMHLTMLMQKKTN